MARLIQKTGFISRKSAGGYMKYIATREGVEVLTGKGPATEKQKEMVAKLLKDFPDVRDSFEYEDYKQAPTLHTASALISAALDSHMQNLQSENGYLKYIATRPGAEKHGAHGLFGRQENTNLTAAMHDLTAHDGNVWTIIYSLHREDAERLEYNNAAAWRKLLVSQQNKFAEAFHVPASALHWYAAYHDADTHPHIHMMIWTDQETVLKRDAVVKLRSVMTNSIFQAELENLYIRKDAAYKDVTEAARAVMHELVDCMEAVSDPPASIQQKLLELALELCTTGGKKQYAYLKKPLKDMVDSIVDELEKLPEVAAYYSVWNGLRDTLEGYYKNRPRQHNPLPQQKEFRAIKNAIIQEAEHLRQQMEQTQAATEQDSSQDEEPSAENTSTDASTNPTLADENTSSVASASTPSAAKSLCRNGWRWGISRMIMSRNRAMDRSYDKTGCAGFAAQPVTFA